MTTSPTDTPISELYCDTWAGNYGPVMRWGTTPEPGLDEALSLIADLVDPDHDDCQAHRDFFTGAECPQVRAKRFLDRHGV